MRRGIVICISLGFLFLSMVSEVHALSIRHHLINASKNIFKTALAPLKGAFITGPKNIKKAYIDEVYKKEDPELRGKLRFKLLGIWRAPGEEVKGIISGLTESVDYAGKTLWELISIFWSD